MTMWIGRGPFSADLAWLPLPVAMTRLVRNTLLVVLIGLYAAITLCGPGLHALPGWSHNSGLTPLARHDHSHGPGPSSHQASDDCPVCQFLVQGQLAPDQVIGLIVEMPHDAVALPVATVVP